MNPIALLLPFHTGAATLFDTPFGPVYHEPRTVGACTFALLTPGTDVRAGPWAARALDALHLLIVVTGGALNPLLRPGDWLVPSDFVDGSRGAPTTYFSDRGIGYVQQQPPVCPTLSACIARLPETPAARVFAHGTLVALPAPRAETPAEARWWQRLGGDVAAWGFQPTAALARELELCVAGLCYLTRTGGAAEDTWLEPPAIAPVLDTLVAHALQTRTCACGNALAFARSRGALTEDWWKTLSAN